MIDHEDERPRCESCPHWNGPDSVGDGTCKRIPPAFVGTPNDETHMTKAAWWQQPITGFDDGCSEHPDFPAWLREWLRARAEEKGEIA